MLCCARNRSKVSDMEWSVCQMMRVKDEGEGEGKISSMTTKLAAIGVDTSEKGNKHRGGQATTRSARQDKTRMCEGNGMGYVERGSAFLQGPRPYLSASAQRHPSPAQDHASDKGARRCNSRVQAT